MVSDDYKRVVPDEYKDLPILQGRAEVVMVIVKPDGSQFNIDGKLYDKVDLKMIIDGYNAPVTGGNFIDLVDVGFYNGRKVRVCLYWSYKIEENVIVKPTCPLYLSV